jgi:D-3-phosphoglycerate dehydrogenase
MEQINRVFSSRGINVAAQYLETRADVGYVVMDIELDDAGPLLEELEAIPATIRVRILR